MPEAQDPPEPLWKVRLLPYYQRVNRLSRGSLEIVRVSLKTFSLARGPEAAASMAYYALFSLFPLLLVMISVAGFILKSEQAYDATLDFVVQALPNSGSLIERNFQQILARRGAIGALGLVGAIWSASGFFNTLVRNINRAWLGVKPRGVIRTRLMALGMIGMIIVLLLLSLISTTTLNLLRIAETQLPDGTRLQDTIVWPYLNLLVPSLFTFLMFVVAYRSIPNTNVRWRASLWGAMWTTVAWELAKRGFSYYVSSGWANYELLYGSLGTVLGLLFWIYLSCVIVLLGAHLTATIDQRKARQESHSRLTAVN